MKYYPWSLSHVKCLQAHVILKNMCFLCGISGSISIKCNWEACTQSWSQRLRCAYAVVLNMLVNINSYFTFCGLMTK